MIKTIKNNQKEGDLSLLILYYDSNKDYIESVVTSVYSQTKLSKEIIIIDNSKKGLNKKYPKIKLIRTNNTSRAKARNAGAKASKGDVLIFLDGDTILGSISVLEKIEEYSKKFSHGYGAKRLWTYEGHFEKNRKIYLSKLKNKDFKWFIKNSFWPEYRNENKGHNSLIGYSFPCNFGFISRELFNKIGGFDERFEGYGGEDDYFAYKMYLSDKKGFKSLFDIPMIHINHPKKETDQDESTKNWKLFEKLLKVEGVKSFNINILFGIPNLKEEAIIEWQK